MQIKEVMCRQGAVSSAHPLATSVGLSVLQDGGNAVDAAIAMAAATSVLMPHMCGPGGDAFILIYDAASGRTTAIMGSGQAPRAATRQAILDRGYGPKMPLFGALSVAVPGAVDAWFTALRLFGSRPASELFAPAIRYAREGVPLSRDPAGTIETAAARLAKNPAAAAIYLKPDGTAPAPGDILVESDLGASLEELARHGPDTFYRGDLAAAIVRCMEEEGGLISAEDLAEHKTEVDEPLSVNYHGYRVVTPRIPSQGLILLEELAIAEGFDLAGMGFGSVDAIHYMVESKKLAFADRLAYAGDPRFVNVPLSGLLSPRYAAVRGFHIRAETTVERLPKAPHGNPWAFEGPAEGDTTSFVVVDAKGNAVSFIHSLSLVFGSGVVVPGTGILLNNRAGRGFTLEPGHPNVIAPGKKTMHTLLCYLVLDGDGRPYLVGGTPGGDGQPQWNFQTIVNILSFGLSPADAVTVPRWTSSPGTDPATFDSPVELRIEDRIAVDTITGLTARGHTVKAVGPWAAGGNVQLIRIDPKTGVRTAVSDPRGSGAAAGY